MVRQYKFKFYLRTFIPSFSLYSNITKANKNFFAVNISRKIWNISYQCVIAAYNDGIFKMGNRVNDK